VEYVFGGPDQPIERVANRESADAGRERARETHNAPGVGKERGLRCEGVARSYSLLPMCVVVRMLSCQVCLECVCINKAGT